MCGDFEAFTEYTVKTLIQHCYSFLLVNQLELKKKSVTFLQKVTRESRGKLSLYEGGE